MREPIRRQKLWFAALSTILFLLGAPLAHAVVQNVSIVGADGNALANTTVTITFPSGKEEEKDTDDKGILIFNADEDGDYILVYPGGKKTISVAASGGGGISTGVKVAGAVIVTGIIASEAIGDDNRSSSSSGTSGGSPPPPPPPPTGMIDGNYTASTSVLSNPDTHPDDFNGQEYIVMTSSGTSVTVGVSGTGIAFSATGSLSGNDFNATTSSAFYEGFTTQVDVTGTFDPSAGTWSGEMTAGADGTLPDTNMNGTSEPIVVSFTGMRL